MRTPADALSDPRPGDVSDTAPQPPPVPTESEPIYRQVIADIEAKAEDGLAKYGTYLQADNSRDHLADAYQESIDQTKYLKAAIVERRALLDRIAALEAELAEAQERLAMAAEALFAYGDRNEMTANPWWAIVAKNRMGSNAILAGPFFSRERAEEHRQARLYEYGKGSIVFCFSGHISQHYKDLRAALTATAPAVAQFVAGVERRGAKAALEAFAERDDWTLDVPRSLVDRIRRLLTEAACAAELEGA